MAQPDVTSVGADAMSVHVADIEARLGELEAAFASADVHDVEAAAARLQRSLADSLVAFRKAEHEGVSPLTSVQINRLKLAQARIQAQQLAVHRATLSIDRTLGVLFAREDATYGNPSTSASPSTQVRKAYGG